MARLATARGRAQFPGSRLRRSMNRRNSIRIVSFGCIPVSGKSPR